MPRRGLVGFGVILGLLGILLIVMVSVYTLSRSAGGGIPVSAEKDVPGGQPRMGRILFQKYGCGSCHAIAGVKGANGKVGPPLSDLAERSYIAGHLENTPENLSFWIQFPQQLEPGTAMPDMDVSPSDAADIAAYLYTLE